jgi:predicted DNA-binding protein
MVKKQTEVIRVRLPKETRLRLQAEAEGYNTDVSKLIRECLKCFVKNHECLARKIIEEAREG